MRVQVQVHRRVGSDKLVFDGLASWSGGPAPALGYYRLGPRRAERYYDLCVVMVRVISE